MVNNGEPAGNGLRRTDDLPDVLQGYRDTVVAAAVILHTAARCGDGWHVTHGQMQRLEAAVQAVLAGECPWPPTTAPRRPDDYDLPTLRLRLPA